MSELSPETRAFIDAAARGDAPSAEDRARVRNKLALELGAVAMTVTGLTVAAQGTAGAAGQGALLSAGAGVTGGKAAVGVGMLGKWLVAVGLASALSTGAAVVALQSAEREPVREPVQQRESVRVKSVPALVVVDSKVSVPAVTGEAGDTGAGAGAGAGAGGKKRKVALATASIAQETALLRDAQLALKAGQPDQALTHTKEHARRFADGALAQEREAVAMLARCALGTLEASALTGYLASAPESPLKARVQKACQSQP